MIDGSENAIVSWLLNFRIRMFVKSTVKEMKFEAALTHFLETFSLPLPSSLLELPNYCYD